MTRAEEEALERKARHDYLAAVAKLEPEVHAGQYNGPLAQMSAAISLKRIVDVLERVYPKG